MEILCFVIAIALLADLWLPVYGLRKRRALSDFHESYKFHKLRAIKGYYPAVSEMSFSEIEKLYDIDEAYDRIGRVELI